MFIYAHYHPHIAEISPRVCPPFPRCICLRQEWPVSRVPRLLEMHLDEHGLHFGRWLRRLLLWLRGSPHHSPESPFQVVTMPLMSRRDQILGLNTLLMWEREWSRCGLSVAKRVWFDANMKDKGQGLEGRSSLRCPLWWTCGSFLLELPVGSLWSRREGPC
jgi:hypothetical protein